jgi:SAM-dependent methyltransferase
VLDLAAGTGKLSELLAPRSRVLFAVEPLPEMRRLLETRVPAATALDGTAEQIPLDDGSVDAVFVGEAFHWFDGGRALPEIHRVLRPGGGLAMLFNQGEWHEAQWAEALVARFDQVPQPDVRPENRPYTGVWRRAFETSDLFSPLQHLPARADVRGGPVRAAGAVLELGGRAASRRAGAAGRGLDAHPAGAVRRRADAAAVPHRRVRDQGRVGSGFSLTQQYDDDRHMVVGLLDGSVTGQPGQAKARPYEAKARGLTSV